MNISKIRTKNILSFVMLLYSLIVIPVSGEATWLTSLEAGKVIELHLQDNQVVKGTVLVCDEENITLDTTTGKVKIAIIKIREVRFQNTSINTRPLATSIPLEVLPLTMSNQAGEGDVENLLSKLKLDGFILKSTTKGEYLILGTITNPSEQALDQLKADIVCYDALGSTLTSQKYTLVSKNEKYTKYSLPPKSTRRVRLVYKKIPLHTATVSLQLKSLNLYDSSYEAQKIDGVYKKTAHNKFKLAAGIGAPYGLLGINSEVAIDNIVGFHGGIGTLSPLDIPSIAFVLGIRLYALPSENPIRLRFGLGYGIGGVVLWKRNNTVSHYDVVNAIQPSLGIEIRLWDNISLNLDGIYLFLDKHEFTNGYSIVRLEDGPAFAIGITFHFNFKESNYSHHKNLSTHPEEEE